MESNRAIVKVFSEQEKGIKDLIEKAIVRRDEEQEELERLNRLLTKVQDIEDILVRPSVNVEEAIEGLARLHILLASGDYPPTKGMLRQYDKGINKLITALGDRDGK